MRELLLPPANSRLAAIASVALRNCARRRLRAPAGANAVVRAAPGRDDRRDSDVAEALAHTVVTRSGRRSCGPVGLDRCVGVRRVTKRVAYASGDAEGEARVSPICLDAP